MHECMSRTETARMIRAEWHATKDATTLRMRLASMGCEDYAERPAIKQGFINFANDLPAMDEAAIIKRLDRLVETIDAAEGGAA